MKLSAEDYMDAALEHLELARRAYQDHREYMVAYYFSGVAVESVLRAYLSAASGDWYAGHDIYELANRSRFLDLIAPTAWDEWKGRLSEMSTRWRSEHRYCSEHALKRYILSSGLHLRKGGDGKTGYVPGNLLKNNALRVLDLAREIVAEGYKRWRESSRR